jgi:hypothetical protein
VTATNFACCFLQRGGGWKGEGWGWGTVMPEQLCLWPSFDKLLCILGTEYGTENWLSF